MHQTSLSLGFGPASRRPKHVPYLASPARRAPSIETAPHHESEFTHARTASYADRIEQVLDAVPMSAAPLATEGECALVGFTGTLRASIFVGMPSRLSIPLDNVTAFCRRHHIRWLALFGSVLRDDFCAGSDVDVLVEFEPGHVPGFRFIAVQEELAELLGRRVDLNTLACLSPYFRDRVLEQAEVQFD